MAFQDAKQPIELSLRVLIKEALGLVENKIDFKDNAQVNLLRDRLSRAIGCADSLRTLELLEKNDLLDKPEAK